MEIQRQKLDGELELKLRGRLDAAWSDLVKTTLAESMHGGEHRISLDMAEVDYLSSAGIRVLLQAYKQLHAIDGCFRIVRPSPAVRSTLELSGLEMLLSAAPSAAPAAAAAGERTQAAEALTAYVVGDAQPGPVEPAAATALQVDGATTAAGIGALGGALHPSQHFGEFLCAGGAACFLPGNGARETDYLLRQKEFVPEARLARGIYARGALTRQFSFGEEGGSPLSALLRRALAAAGGSQAVVVITAETAWLVGAALRRSPAAHSDLFAFPAVRDAMTFTGEPAHLDTVSLIVGFAARDGSCAALRPLVPERDLYGHLHAVAFSYAPIRKGVLELEHVVQNLFENQSVRGMLHLLNDWRDSVGCGESRLTRGVCWYAPVQFAPEQRRAAA